MSLYSRSISSSIWGIEFRSFNGGIIEPNLLRRSSYCNVRINRSISRVFAMSDGNQTAFKMNLNEYMVTLEKPLGIRFALSLDGKVFVHALRKGGNAEKSRIVMVGDTLRKASDSSGGQFIEIKDIGDAQYAQKSEEVMDFAREWLEMHK